MVSTEDSQSSDPGSIPDVPTRQILILWYHNFMATISLFLGGTVAHSTWRKSLIGALVVSGVDRESIFDPTTNEWTLDCQAEEDAAKASAKFNLFYLCDPRQDGNPVSVYSLVEAVMGLYDQPSNTIVVFDNEGYTGHALKSLIKAEQDLINRFPNGLIFGSRAQVENFLIHKLGTRDVLGVQDFGSFA